jgi:hypothetical protein
MIHVTMWISLTKEANFLFRGGTSTGSRYEGYVKLCAPTERALEDTRAQLAIVGETWICE